MKHRFIHLSDLHYKKDKPEAYGLILKSLWEDLEGKNPTNTKIIFSGDFIYSGQSNEDRIEIINILNEKLSHLGIEQGNRYCTPGNHDISQDAINKISLIQRGILAEMTEESIFNDNLPTLHTQLQLEAKFANYKALEEAITGRSYPEHSISGHGWKISDDLSLYCLNTSLCSFGGLKDSNGNAISDQKKLMIDTRSLYKWLASDKATTRILVMHHPIEWLADWAQSELMKIANSSFKLAFFGHIHEGFAEHHANRNGSCVFITAPALFSKKGDNLGYSITTLDTSDGTVDIEYRQLSQNYKFVLGTLLAGNDSGIIRFHLNPKHTETTQPPPTITVNHKEDTLCILTKKFNESVKYFSNKPGFWVERHLSKIPESNSNRKNTPEFALSEFAINPFSCIIRAPREFGLTSCGHFIAFKHYEKNDTKPIILIDCNDIKTSAKDIEHAITKSSNETKVPHGSIYGLILDNWNADKRGKKILSAIKELHPSALLIILNGVDDCTQLSDFIQSEEKDPTEGIGIYYLWSLDRSGVRALVEQYGIEGINIDGELVTKKVITDLDTLNTHRTPLSCLLMLRLLEQAFDDSPVNRTEMISRVLNILFFQFDAIPSYATRPDLKDCEFALGYLCEILIRESRKSFTKREFHQKLDEQCVANHIDIDIDILFAFLVSENILLSKGGEFEFRFNYWLYYFSAHRMHHNKDFADFMLTEGRYSAYPEILEFYAGITRRCQDAVNILIKDLKTMSAEFLTRTGISGSFNPLLEISWHPTDQALSNLRKEVIEDESMAAVPAVIKDAIADSNYDRKKPYDQELAKFITSSSLSKMMLAVKGAARTLRNSDYVTPDSKSALLNEVITCWCRVAQILLMLSPALANAKQAHFEGINFMLDHTFDHLDTTEKRWQALTNAIASNVVNWYQDDIFSKKMGPLLVNYLKTHDGELGELLAAYVIIKQKPTDWEKEVERIIIKENKNSFYLNRIFSLLINDCKLGYNSERNRQYLRRLSAMAIAKHDTGSEHPNNTLVEKVAKRVIDGKISKPTNFFRRTFG